jgi:hypothetical protein
MIPISSTMLALSPREKAGLVPTSLTVLALSPKETRG